MSALMLAAIFQVCPLLQTPADLPLQAPEGWESRKKEGGLLLVPKEHVESLMTAGPQHEALMGKMLLLAARLAREQGSDNGFRVVINNGPGGGQEVFHLHMHVLAGPRPWKRTL